LGAAAFLAGTGFLDCAVFFAVALGGAERFLAAALGAIWVAVVAVGAVLRVAMAGFSVSCKKSV
jgi:hypothetical protein